MAKRIMIQGTMSGAGKSLLVTALCRIFAQDGYRVAPFKSQNMALNSFVTPDGLELGRAQAVQAEAAGVECDVRMNPILLKPSSDTGSQLIVNGEVRGHYDAREYFRMKRGLIPDVLNAYRSLEAENDILVIEGAGSPAEINLREDDIVNMGLAELVNAPVLLAGDIDRGGVFAQLYGTVALLREEERRRVEGTVINKFRGDAQLLRPGLKQLEALTQVPVLGVVPYLRADIDDEDSLAPCLGKKHTARAIRIAVIRLPHISNFTDFAPLEEHPGIGTYYADRPDELGEPDMIILPGTKNTMADLGWLRDCGLAGAVVRRSSALTRSTWDGPTPTALLPSAAFRTAGRTARSAARSSGPICTASLTAGRRWKSSRTGWQSGRGSRSRVSASRPAPPQGTGSTICWPTRYGRPWTCGAFMRSWRSTPMKTRPAEIENGSMAIIKEELRARGIALPPENAAVILRCIHASADFDYAGNLRFSSGAVDTAAEALKHGAEIVTDTNMALAGISRPGLRKLGSAAYCFMADERVAEAARERGTTRAAAAVDWAAAQHPTAILAVGNAPTALFRIAEKIEAGLRPSLVIGVPVV